MAAGVVMLRLTTADLLTLKLVRLTFASFPSSICPLAKYKNTYIGKRNKQMSDSLISTHDSRFLGTWEPSSVKF